MKIQITTALQSWVTNPKNIFRPLGGSFQPTFQNVQKETILFANFGIRNIDLTAQRLKWMSPF